MAITAIQERFIGASLKSVNVEPAGTLSAFFSDGRRQFYPGKRAVIIRMSLQLFKMLYSYNEWEP
jgi:hypothetical protein